MGGKSEVKDGTVQKESDINEINQTFTAIKASKAFDLMDESKSGILSICNFKPLIENLGEGFDAGELQAQIQKIDPNDTKSFEKTAFIEWYVSLVEEEDESLDSDERADREESKEEGLEIFEQIAPECDIVSLDYIPVDKFPKLIKELGATYCEEEHKKTIKKLKNDDKIFKEDFIAWYIDWLYSDDLSLSESEEEVEKDKEKESGWGDLRNKD